MTYLDITTFVDQFANWFQVRVSPCNVWLSNTQHVDGGFVQFDENTIVDLTQTEQLQHFTYFWCYFVDTEMEWKNNWVIRVSLVGTAMLHIIEWLKNVHVCLVVACWYQNITSHSIHHPMFTILLGKFVKFTCITWMMWNIIDNPLIVCKNRTNAHWKPLNLDTFSVRWHVTLTHGYA